MNRKHLLFVGIVVLGLVSAAHAQAPAETTPPVDTAAVRAPPARPLLPRQ